MPMFANQRYRVFRWHSVPTENVNGMSHCFQMGGINTSPVSAEMVKLHPGRNRKAEELPCEPMRFDMVTSYPETPIALVT